VAVRTLANADNAQGRSPSLVTTTPLKPVELVVAISSAVV
jgi:hypothetical protein